MIVKKKQRLSRGVYTKANDGYHNPRKRWSRQHQVLLEEAEGVISSNDKRIPNEGYA